jgi:hypothetical protein
VGNVIIHEDFIADAQRKGEMMHIQFRDQDANGMDDDMHVFSMDLETAQQLITRVQSKIVHVATVEDLRSGPHAP